MYTSYNRADSVTINPGTREIAWIYCHIVDMITGALAIYEWCYGAAFRSLGIKCLASHYSVFRCLFHHFRWQNFTTENWSLEEFCLFSHQKSGAITIPSQIYWTQPKMAVTKHPTPPHPHPFHLHPSSWSMMRTKQWMFFQEEGGRYIKCSAGLVVALP